MKMLWLGLLLFVAGFSFAQESAQAVYLRRYQNGTQLYQASRWDEAAVEFRRAQEVAANVNEWSRALYWVILSQLAYTDYGSALLDMDELEKTAPNSSYTRDMVYHRARVYFNLGYFEDSLLLFRQYIESVTESDLEYQDRIAAAYFWMGECLYTMGQFEEAEKFYIWVVDNHPDSPKQEISTYRLELIKQKRIEAELLALLQWSHEESLRTGEEYQRRLRTYEYTLNAYQRRVAELTHGSQEPLQQDDEFEDDWESLYNRLLERARELSVELEVLIDDYVSGGPW